MKTTAASTFGKITVAGAFVLLSASTAVAEDRADVLERIAPIGKVTVEGQAASAVAETATPTPVAASETTPEEAAAEATESAPAAEGTAAVTEAAAEVEAAVTEAVEEVAAATTVDAQTLATSSGCMGCHQLEAKVVGPAYKEVAAKYKDEAGALDMLIGKVKAGGVGTWGQIPMPPNAHVSEEDIRTIVEWVLSL